MELYAIAAELGSRHAHFELAAIYHQGGDLKKAKFHYEAAAMAGHEVARYNLAGHEVARYLGSVEAQKANSERALKHLRIVASAGDYSAMHYLRTIFEKGFVSRESIDSTLTAYNNSCAETRSEARDAYIRILQF
jgi:TPR repeat protein